MSTRPRGPNAAGARRPRPRPLHTLASPEGSLQKAQSAEQGALLRAVFRIFAQEPGLLGIEHSRLP